jgi:hypothetical protein
VHHSLLISGLIVPEPLFLLEGLSDPGNVTVPKDAEAPSKKRLLLAVPLDVLITQKPDKGLCGRESRRAHGVDQSTRG